MFEGIIAGKYIDSDGSFQRLDARTKIILTIVLAAMIFSAQKTGILYMLLVCIIYVLISRVGLRAAIKSIRPIIFLAAITLIFNTLLTEGQTIFSFWIFRPTYEGLQIGVTGALRLILLVMSASIMTFTTKPLELTDAIERLLKPLSIFKVPTKDIAMTMGIAINFIPIIGEEASKIIEAQKSRGADFDGKGIFNKAKAALPLIIPLIAAAIRRSEALADAMDSRCYGLGERTQLKESKLKTNDVIALLSVFIAAAGLWGVSRL